MDQDVANISYVKSCEFLNIYLFKLVEEPGIHMINNVCFLIVLTFTSEESAK